MSNNPQFSNNVVPFYYPGLANGQGFPPNGQGLIPFTGQGGLWQSKCNNCKKDGEVEGCKDPNCKKCCQPKFFFPQQFAGKNPCPLKSLCDPNLVNSCLKPAFGPVPSRRPVTTWKVNYLVSNQVNLASHIDTDLINPWGIVIFNNQLWIANNGSDSLTNYDMYGNKLLGSITVRDENNKASYPTGIAINCNGNFTVTNGSITQAAVFIISTEHSTVQVYNPNVYPLNTVVEINTKIIGVVCVFRGIALVDNRIYVADLFQSRVGVYDSSYNPLTGFNFIDGDTADPIPEDYGPNNIVHIQNHLYVLWARKDPNIPLQAISGPGYGYVSVFNPDGSFVRRFTSRGVLNNPWAMINAPCECGIPPGSFLITNHGDGRTNIFDCNGRYVGPLLNMSGLPLVIDGMRGLAPHYTNFNEIYFTSSSNELTNGLVGSITKDQVIYI